MAKAFNYQNKEIFLPTKHKKSMALSHAFDLVLNSKVIELPVDTDLLGTFTREVQRTKDAIQCAREKCLMAIKEFNVDIVVASEGSFGSHSTIPFLKSNQEILYFFDTIHDFEFYTVNESLETNMASIAVKEFDEVLDFCEKALFPSHAIILSSSLNIKKRIMFKGVQKKEELFEYFERCLNESIDGVVHLETDMRAHMNPSRMNVIAQTAFTLAHRLNSFCPECFFPSWGQIGVEAGLPCRICETQTNLIKYLIYGCIKCQFKIKQKRPDGLMESDPMYCNYCNP